MSLLERVREWLVPRRVILEQQRRSDDVAQKAQEVLAERKRLDVRGELNRVERVARGRRVY